MISVPPVAVDAIAGLVSRQEPDLPQPTAAQIRLATAPEYFGSILAWLFFGFVGLQFYQYAASRSRDPIWLKLLVYFVMILLVLQLGFETYSGYASLVAGWGDTTLIIIPPKYLILEPFFDAVLALCVQNFFVWRIWAFQRNLLATIFCAVISALSIIQTVGGIAIPALFFSIDVQSKLVETTHVYNLLWLACGVAIDLLITISMTIILRDAQSRTLTQATKTKLGRLIRLTVQSGAFTAFLAIVILILFEFQAKIGLTQTIPGYMLGKSYVLSLLANLNIRSEGGFTTKTGRTTGSGGRTDFTVPSSSLHFERSRTFGRNNKSNAKYGGETFLSTRDVGFSELGSPTNPSETITSLNEPRAMPRVVISKHSEQFHDDSDPGDFPERDDFLHLQTLDSSKYKEAQANAGQF